jgi:hypothetical protein
MLAVHEAGHAVMLRRFGVRWVEAVIFEREDAVPAAKKWGGRVSVLDHSRLARLSQHRLAMVGVAGMIAGHAWTARNNPDDLAFMHWPDVLEDPACMSPSDWDRAGCAPNGWGRKQVRACEAVAAMLMPSSGELWGALRDTARALIRDRAVRWLPMEHGPA